MTNRLAIILGVLVVGGVLADYLLNDAAELLFLAKKLFALLDWLAFWH